ncbi:MAG: hypothetical protein JSV91_09815 [Phycisphaerales bacterium]|nr:MAG: hypothetical protein JSV91_09815 [Phycisphaerales bacterium]
MESSYLRMVTAILCCSLALSCINGCGDESVQTTGNEPAQETTPGQTESAPATGDAATIDWSVIKAASPEDAMGGFISLSRHLTAWHQGSIETIIMDIKPNGTATDGHGNSVGVPLEQWKAMLEFIATYSKPTVPMLTPSQDFEGDGPGVLPKYVYEIDSTAPDKLRFVCKGEFERR